MKVYIGADWDKAKCVVTWREGGQLRHRNVQRNPESVEEFARDVRKAPMGEAVEIEVGLESGDLFWVLLWARFADRLWVFDGKKAHRFGESLSVSGARDDRRSAQTLLAMVESPAHRDQANVVLPEELRELQFVLTEKRVANEDVVAKTNRLWALLHQYHPGLGATHESLQTKWMLNALALAPTAAAWKELNRAQRDKALSGSRLSERLELAERFGRDYGAVSASMERNVRRCIRGVVRQLCAAREVEAHTAAALKELVDGLANAQHFRDIDGIGSVIGAALALAFGTASLHRDVESKGQRDAAAVVLGAVPVTCRSGTTGDSAPQAKLRRNANAFMRAIPYLLGLQLVLRYRWAKAAFAYYRARGKTAGTAYRCLTRSFLRILQGMERDGTTFDEDRYIAALKSHGVPWAMSL